MMTYCSKYTLFTPRNGRRKFRSPVQIPSRVLQCTSQTPSPSSSRANSPRLWLTVACPRSRRPSGLYPFQSSVYTIAPGRVAGRTVASISSAELLRWPTRNHTRRLARPTTPGTAGRSVSQVPWPLAWLARRRGGSSGSVCGTPFFPRVLIHLVGLGLIVRQRRAVGGVQRAGLDLMPQPQQVLATDPYLTGERRRGDPLGDATKDQEDLGRAEVRPLPKCPCVHVEHPPAPLAAVVDDRVVGVTAVDIEPLPGGATRAGEPLGVEQIEELLAANLLVHQVKDREVHGIGPEEQVVGNSQHGPESRTVPG